jgi:hypothetical protein
MRRLLVFGTGAAVIGILLLVVAFYEAYVIVNDLQSNLSAGTTSPSTNLLTDASLQAVFLGVMAALGYALIAKGLDGIRKQELVDIQKGTAARIAQVRPRSRAAMPSREAQLQAMIGEGAAQEAIPAGAVVLPGPETSSMYSTLDAGAAETPTKPDVEVTPPATAVPSEVQVEPALIWQQVASSKAVETTAREPVQASGRARPPVEQVRPEPEPEVAPTPTQTPVAESEPAPVSPMEPVTQPDASSLKTAETNQVAWEGGAPESLKGVEILPEPATHGATATFEEVAATPTVEPEPSGDELSQPAVVKAAPGTASRKRQRGRPKGSTKKKPETTGDAEQTS